MEDQILYRILIAGTMVLNGDIINTKDGSIPKEERSKRILIL